MKRTLFYIAALALVSCKPSPKQIAPKTVHAIEYTRLEGTEDYRPDTIRRDTLFHLAAVSSDVILIDSIRVNTYRYPEHTLRMVQYEDSTGVKTITCLAIFPDGSYQTYKEYSQWYYTPSETFTHALRDTLTRVHSTYNYSAGAWVQKQMLLKTSKSLLL